MSKLLSQEELDRIQAVVDKPPQGALNATVRPLRDLLGHVKALNKQLASGGSVTATVGMMEVEVSAGDDKKLGTKDDKVSISRAKKKPAAKKKAAPKKKAASKKKS